MEGLNQVNLPQAILKAAMATTALPGLDLCFYIILHISTSLPFPVFCFFFLFFLGGRGEKAEGKDGGAGCGTMKGSLVPS